GDVLATWTGAVRAQAEGVDPARRGAAGYGTFETADGRYVTLAVLTEDHFWKSVCDVLDLLDERDLTFTQRMARVSELNDALATRIRERVRDEVVAALLGAGAPVAPVLDRAEMVALDHF